MPDFISKEKIKLYRSLFLWREDIYAIRWEKNWNSGYMPAYDFDWNEFSAHRAKWWNISNFENKTLLALTDKAIYSHLLWGKTLWIYPLLANNNSNFIVADFDKKNWLEECKNLIKVCEVYDIPTYIERSRSWNGWHVWIFFESKYPAIKSRKILFELLKKSLNVSIFEKEFSFDRLFPNQDYLTWKWFGNLIALPFQWESLKQDNSCFINVLDASVIENQWEFLENIEKISVKELDEIYSVLVCDDKNIETPIISNNINWFEIIIRNQIIIKRENLTPNLIKFLKDSLNFFNSDYLVKKRLWKSTYKTEKYFKVIDESDLDIAIPIWFLKQLEDFLKKNNTTYTIKDYRNTFEEIEYSSSIDLYDYQEKVLLEIEQEDSWIIVAPPWAGKTVMWLEFIARKKQPALIIVHRRELYDQWIERIESFLWIIKKDIWQVWNWKYKVWKSWITIAMMQTIVKKDDLSEIKNKFGLIIIDECHHIPAKTFREAVVNFNSKYIYGFTATPKRKNNDEKLIYCYIWDIISTIDRDFKKVSSIKNHINIKETNLFVPFDYKIDNYEMVSKVLVYDTDRNTMIVEDLIKEIWKNRKIIVLTERKDHVMLINMYLKNQHETITLTWDDGIWKRKLKFQQIKSWNFQVLISTWQLIWEWLDIWELDCLFLVYPFSFEWKLIQYIWRIQRTKKKQVIYDYHDKNIDYFDKLFKKRQTFYNKLEKSWRYKIIRR